MAEANFRDQKVQDIPKHISLRSHRRYGLKQVNQHVNNAWNYLVSSSYLQDLSVRERIYIFIDISFTLSRCSNTICLLFF